MKMKVFLFGILLAAALVALSGLSGLAQEKQPPQEKNKKTTTQEVDVEEQKVETDANLESTESMDEDSEMGTDTGEFVYRPKGRRDPFWDLLMGKSTKVKKEAKEGIAGLEIEQLELEGIVNRNGKYIALFKGPDSKPYDVQIGQSVYDGEIIEINANSVVFKKILTIALGGTKEKTVIKWLNPEKEKEQ
ncbi:MAG: pilus assembly protein PilP [Candidatus Aminicenantes bacterium]|nr:pilus assembly protein PilP [Candidatus Aminicenantes bacterium]